MNLTCITPEIDELLNAESELDQIVECLASALALRDSETEEHTRRVVAMTLSLARAAGVPDTELVHIRRGTILHDIGKIGIPDFILRKSAPLSCAEWDIMKLHPVYAHELISLIPRLRPAEEIPYCHHEKWDGSGYPRGLMENHIPLAARIFSVVDVCDALCSNRPYRPAWTTEQAIDYIGEQSGEHFDPDIVDLFLNEVLD